MPVMNMRARAYKKMGSAVGSEGGMKGQDLLEGDMREFDVSVQVFAYCSPHRNILRQCFPRQSACEGTNRRPVTPPMTRSL